MTEDLIYARNGQVHICIASGYDREHTECTLDEAREYAQQLADSIAECERQAEAIRAACADGHDWGSGLNGYRPWPDTKVTSYYCSREGCDAWKAEPGWVEFAGRLHIEPVTGRQIDCYGPGCENCAHEKVGKAMRQMLAAARESLTSHLGVALGGPKEN